MGNWERMQLGECLGFPGVSALHHIVGPGWNSCSPELQHGKQPQSCVFLELLAIPLGRVQDSWKVRDGGDIGKWGELEAVSYLIEARGWKEPSPEWLDLR